jgi:hypothetical protein
VPVPAVGYETFIASVESIRCYSHFREKGKINAVRLPDMNIAINKMITSQGWLFMSQQPLVREEVAHEPGNVLH